MFSETLNRRENEVMCAVYTLSGGKERFLATPYDLLALLSNKGGYDEERLEGLLYALQTDGYFEFILSTRKGEKTYVVQMREKGLSFSRSNVQRRRGLAVKLAFTVVCAVLSFLIGLALKAIFS